MKAAYDPYSVQRITGGDVYWAGGGTGYSAFPAWNHWPVAQFLSDGRHAIFPDRAAHSSLTHIVWDDSVPFGKQGRYEEKQLLEGMSDRPAKELLPLAMSWLQPAPATSPTEGPRGGLAARRSRLRPHPRPRGGEEPADQARRFGEHPIVNPVLIVENWGQDRTATITLNGNKPEPSIDIRQGLVTRANGVKALVVWIEHTSNAALEIGIE